IFSYRPKKSVITFGTKASVVNFDQTDLYTSKQYDRNFMNWNPQASYQYNFTTQKSFRLNYFGSTSQPNISQIQPVRVNTDPLNITLGNPELGPSFNNRFSIGYNSYKVISDRNIYFNGSYSFTSNAIVNNTVTDQAGKSTFQSINLGSKSPFNFYIYSNFSRKIPGTNLRAGLNVNVNGNTYYNMINNVLNKTQSETYTPRLTFSSYKAKKYDFYAGIGPSYSKSQSDLQKNINNNGWTTDAYMEGNLYLPGKVKVGLSGSYFYQQKTQSFNEDFGRFLLNTTLTKSFMKDEGLKLQLSGNDLFNQNTGFSRRATSNMITQNSYTTIRRYAMFSLIYDVSKMGGPQPKK
ncbi:outer membrane beta-barrel protein, partial [Daejeonella sp.]|uniref:outer membrane beta-barrel protein n=1 Tax=Daejeonella sp. TaxID=2805397 RepID=UPI0030C02015